MHDVEFGWCGALFVCQAISIPKAWVRTVTQSCS